MESIMIKKFKAEFEMVLFKDIELKIFFDENGERLISDGATGERYIKCYVRLKDLKNDEDYDYQYYFPLDVEIESSIGLFKNETELILKNWRKSCPIDWVNPSNPECAWIYYKKTFNRVMNGQEIWNGVKCSSEIECEQSDGNVILLKHLQDGSERLFLNDEYLGRVDTIKSEETGIEYCDCKEEDSKSSFFVCDTSKMKKHQGGEYKSFLYSEELFFETGIHIFHAGNLQGIIEGAAMAAKEFESRKMQKMP